jgi:L-aminopeptidase/D-esterase-like protein
MSRPGKRNLITDVDGINVGNAQDPAARSGSTIVLPDTATVAAVDVRGGAPGTRDVDSLDPSCVVEAVQAISLSGGSVYGFDAASGAASWLSQQGRGVAFGGATIPVVPAAILFDFPIGGDRDWGLLPPFRDLGIQACENAGKDFDLGNVGAGYGATAGSLKGGLGSVSMVTDDGIQVGAIMAVNPFGSVVMPGTDAFWAWPWAVGDEIGGAHPQPEAPTGDDGNPFQVMVDRGVGNTTIGVVATNVALDKAQAKRVAIMAQDGIARAIRPVHTPVDGDTIFVISTAQREPAEPLVAAVGQLGMMAADCVARAIARGVFAAESLGDFPSYKKQHNGRK